MIPENMSRLSNLYLQRIDEFDRLGYSTERNIWLDMANLIEDEYDAIKASHLLMATVSCYTVVAMLEKLGPFKIGQVLGRGGMGAVYEGTHEKDNVAVAIKVLPDSFDEDNEARLRFETEIETLKLLSHPNIVRLTGFGAEQGQLYYVMEFVNGLSLQQELRKKRDFQWHEVAKIGFEICQALRHAHDRGVIHRDIKPANILLDHEGHSKLSDFGIARFFGAQQITDVHSIIGTLEYMSPEQALAHPIGSSTDLYSLGCVLYALLHGKPPFPARSLPELLRKHQTTTPVPICSIRHDVPDELGYIISDLLQIHPEDRPRNAFLVMKRLQTLLLSLMGDPTKIKVLPMLLDMPNQQSEDMPQANKYDNDRVVPSDIQDRVALLPQSESSHRTDEKQLAVIFPTSIGSEESKKSKRVTPHTETATSLSISSAAKQQRSKEVLAETQTSRAKNEDVLPEPSVKLPNAPARFTAVASKNFDPFQEADQTSRPMLSLPIVLTSTMLIIIGLTVYYLIQPVPPEVLYDRIIATIKEGEPEDGYSPTQLIAAQKDIRRFLDTYKAHPSAEQILMYQDELDLLAHERRLERRIQFSAFRSLSPIERTYVQVLNSSPHDPDQMIDKLRAFIAVFQTVQSLEESSKPHRLASSPVEICVALARRRLEKLEQDVEEINAEQEQVIRRRLDDAAEWDSQDPERAEGIRRGIIELYQHNRWAKELIEEAKQLLKPIER